MSKGTFHNAHDFSITNPQFVNQSWTIDNSQTVDNSQTTINPQTIIQGRAIGNHYTGLQTLLDASIPAAFHDSSARDPPPKCHPGTRYDYIDQIMEWATNSDDRISRILWIRGPAGVGKSAVAQSCAEALGDKLGAAFFFSEFNARHDPNRFFTSISYRLATKIDLYGDILDRKIDRDPTLVERAPRHQFQDLIVSPLNELKARGGGKDIGELVVIVDGLDECAGSRSQCNIINIVADSVRNRTTPLLWVFLSRPEPHITATFTSPEILPLSLHLELPISRDIDNEIAKFLTDELERLRKEYEMPVSWPSERAIGTLVNLSAGLFIYAATVIRFIEARGSSGPDDQLRSILALDTPRPVQDKANFPLAGLDFFYTMIMRHIPPETLLTTRKVLLATTFSFSVSRHAPGHYVIPIANLLGLSDLQLQSACRDLHSVLKLGGRHIQFYHASFMQFLQDPTRSGELCIKSGSVVALRVELLRRLNVAHTNSSAESIHIPITWPEDPQFDKPVTYCNSIRAFFNLCQSIPLDPETLNGLLKFDYRRIFAFVDYINFAKENLDPEALLQNIPRCHQRKIVRRSHLLVFFRYGLFAKPVFVDPNQPYVLGRRKNKVLCWPNSQGSTISAYPDIRDGSIAKFFVNKLFKA